MGQSYRLSLAAVIICYALFTASAWTACKKNPCKGTTCLNGGVCGDGECDCPYGFEGDGCEIDVRPGFRGTWEGKACMGNSYTKPERLEIKTADSAGYVKLVYEGFLPIYGKQTGNSLSIDRQGLNPSSASGGYSMRYIKGTMTRVHDTITYHYNYEESIYRSTDRLYYECDGRYMRD